MPRRKLSFSKLEMVLKLVKVLEKNQLVKPSQRDHYIYQLTKVKKDVIITLFQYTALDQDVIR